MYFVAYGMAKAMPFQIGAVVMKLNASLRRPFLLPGWG